MIALFLAGLLSIAPANAATTTAMTVRQGDTVVFDAPSAVASATFDGAPTPFFPYRGSYRVVAGIAASRRNGDYPLVVTLANGETAKRTVLVRGVGKAPRIALGVPQKLGLTPAGLVGELKTQNVDINSFVSKWAPAIFFEKPFGLPLWDNRKVSSVFGEVRVTGGTEIRHLGVDFDGKKGAPVAAINAGVVRKAYVDPIYGKSVIVDHGGGIFSLSLHLHEITVKEGDTVKKGTVIGTLGESGYATSPHLHLSIKVGGVSVDPLRFVRIFK